MAHIKNQDAEYANSKQQPELLAYCFSLELFKLFQHNKSLRFESLIFLHTGTLLINSNSSKILHEKEIQRQDGRALHISDDEGNTPDRRDSFLGS